MSLTTIKDSQKFYYSWIPTEKAGLERTVYHVAIKLGEDGWFLARCVELSGAITQGRTREKAVERSIEAISLLLEESGRRDVEFVVTPFDG